MSETKTTTAGLAALETRIDATLDPKQYVITCARNIVRTHGLDDTDPGVASSLAAYATRCEEHLRNFDFAALKKEVWEFELVARKIARPERNEIGEIAARESVYARADLAGWGSNEVEMYTPVASLASDETF